jgi:hypothetical protein
MRNSYSLPPDSRDETIRRLRDELYTARATILSLMTQEQQSLLKSYYDYRTRTESYRWESDVVDKLIDATTILSREQGSHFGPRAFCPLCGDGTSSPYEAGFSVPEGLRRHLVGWGGGNNQCSVFSAASRLAHDYFNNEFKEVELREQAGKAAVEQSRRASETLYLVDPYGEPELSDSSLGYGSKARTAQELGWAEARLLELGFQKREAGAITSYVNDGATCTVYADPRRLGQISFVVYRLPLPKKRPRSTSLFSISQRFSISDNWRNDLPSKYEKRVSEALNALQPKAKR